MSVISLFSPIGTLTVIEILCTMDMGYCYLDMTDLDFRVIFINDKYYNI